MYTVEIDYCGSKIVETYRTKKQVDKRFYGWYYHGLDMCGQATSTFKATDKNGNVIISDRY